jgi:TetR/AcrR family transcriptional regulator, transcriptional repressor for nem operon
VDYSVHCGMIVVDRQVQLCEDVLVKTAPPSEEKTTYTTRGASTRQRIVDATASLTYAKGVEGTSLDDVRGAAGVSKSQLYHYFADKDALIREVIASQTAHVLAAQGAALAQLDSLAALRHWCDRILALNKGGRNGGCPIGSLANELSTQSEPARALLVAGFQTWEDRLAEGFAKMQQKGVLERSADPRELAIGVLCAVQGGLLLAKTSRGEGPLKIALDMALDHVAGHSRPGPSSSSSGASGSAKKRPR